MYEGREGLTPEKRDFQRAEIDLRGLSFAQTVERIRPTAIVGAAAQRQAFSEEVVTNLQKVQLLSHEPMTCSDHESLRTESYCCPSYFLESCCCAKQVSGSMRLDLVWLLRHCSLGSANIVVLQAH